jgi:hypothetical protein
MMNMVKGEKRVSDLMVRERFESMKPLATFKSKPRECARHQDGTCTSTYGTYPPPRWYPIIPGFLVLSTTLSYVQDILE